MSGQCKFMKLSADGKTWYCCLGRDNTPHKHRHVKTSMQAVKTKGKWVSRRESAAHLDQVPALSKMEAATRMADAIRKAKPHLLNSAKLIGGMSPSGQAILDALDAWENASEEPEPEEDEGCPPGMHEPSEPCRICDPSLTEEEHERLACRWAAENDASLSPEQKKLYLDRAAEIESGMAPASPTVNP